MAPEGWNSLSSASVAMTGSGSPTADPNRSIRVHANAWYVVISTWSWYGPRIPAVRSRIWATAARENDRNSARGVPWPLAASGRLALQGGAGRGCGGAGLAGAGAAEDQQHRVAGVDDRLLGGSRLVGHGDCSSMKASAARLAG